MSYTIGNTDIIITSSGVTKVDTKEEDETLGWKGKVITTLLTEKEGLLESEDVIQRGYKPVNVEIQTKVCSAYEYAVFEFPKPTTIDSIVYQVILKGIKSNDHFDIIEKMKQFIVAGE